LMKSTLFPLLLVAAVVAVPVAEHSDDGVRLSNGAKLTVSGLSAGAFMAQQFAVAFSSSVSGVGVFAGGPFYCAQGSQMTALTACMKYPAMINMNTIVSNTKQFAADKKIDDLSNLAGQKVYLYSGTEDSVVNPGVVKQIEAFYTAVGGKVTKTEYSIDSEHGMPTLDYGEACTQLGNPYVLKCDYDGAGEAFKTFYPQRMKPAMVFNESSILLLDQHKFVPAGKTSIGLGNTARVFVPSGCKDNSTVCDIHVAFHGCLQFFDNAKGAYTIHGGFNGYAEANNIIMLYPQSEKEMLKNPNGCFDWFAYSGPDYAFKTGAQMSTVMNMVEYLASGGR